MAADRNVTIVRTLVGVVLALMGVTLLAQAQPRATVLPGQRHWVIGGWWRQAEGLPQDRVIALRQTRDGYLWAGTRGGVARFDGVRFAVWDRSSRSAPPEGEVFDLLESADGGLWLGVYGGGLTRFKDGVFTTLTAKDGLVDNYVRSISIGNEGSVWVGTDRGLSRYRDGRFTTFHVTEGLADETVRVVFADARDGSVFVGTDRGLQRLVHDRFQTVELSSTPQDVSVDSILRDRAGRLWVATSVGLFSVDGPTIRVYGPEDGLSSRAVRAVYEDSEGRIWAATSRGLDCSEPSQASSPVFASVIGGVDVTAVVEDREHSIWVGCRGHGLVRLQRSLFRVFDSLSGLPADSAITVFHAQDGTVWTGTGTALASIRGAHVDTYGVESGLPDRAVSSLAEDATRHLWVGTEAGLFRSAAPIRCRPAGCEARFIPVTGHPALRTHVRVLRTNGPDTMLAGTDSDGVIVVSTSGSPPAPRLLVPGEIRALVRETADRVWVGKRSGGLLLWTPGGTTTYSTGEGLSHDNVQALYLDASKTLWIGTRRGLSWMQNGRIVSVTADQGLRENHIYGITADREGRLWFSSGSGIFTVPLQALADYAAGRRAGIVSTIYGLEHGLPSTLCAVSHDPVITTAPNGDVWVATLGGLVVIDPAVQRTRTASPLVHMESVTIDGTQFGTGELAEIAHGRGNLVFRFAAPGFLEPGKIVFRFRLEGFDPSWIEGGSSREARFTNIPPGRYRFAVLARNADGVWSEAAATAGVYLVPHFYQQAWFTLLVGVAIAGALAGIGVGIHRTRVRRLKENERELGRRVDEAVVQIKVLRGLLPICAWCRRVRDDAGYWTQMEAYVKEHSQAEFSHGVCPDCLRANFPEDADGLDTDADPKPGHSGS